MLPEVMQAPFNLRNVGIANASICSFREGNNFKLEGLFEEGGLRLMSRVKKIAARTVVVFGF